MTRAFRLLGILGIVCAFVPSRSLAEEPGFAAGRDALTRGALADAGRFLEEALKTEPGNRDGLVRLAYVYYLQGESEKARTLLTEILKAGDDTACDLMLADLLYRQRDLAGAREMYLRLDEAHPGIRIVNIRLYETFRYEDRERAHKYYLRSLQLPPTELKEYLGLPGSVAERSSTDWYSESDRPNRRETAVSNDIVGYLMSDEPADRNASGSNVTVLGQTRSKGDRPPLRFFRPVRAEKVIARLIGSAFIALCFGIAALGRRRKERGGSDEIVFSQYKNKGQARRNP
jgi:tetratricopeptide (TPR) repeat protein